MWQSGHEHLRRFVVYCRRSLFANLVAIDRLFTTPGAVTCSASSRMLFAYALRSRRAFGTDHRLFRQFAHRARAHTRTRIVLRALTAPSGYLAAKTRADEDEIALRFYADEISSYRHRV